MYPGSKYKEYSVSNICGRNIFLFEYLNITGIKNIQKRHSAKTKKEQNIKNIIVNLMSLTKRRLSEYLSVERIRSTIQLHRQES